MTTDRGLAALTAALHGYFGDTDYWPAVADAILGERGVFLPDGPPPRAYTTCPACGQYTEIVGRVPPEAAEIAWLRKIEEAARRYVFAIDAEAEEHPGDLRTLEGWWAEQHEQMAALRAALEDER